MKKFYIRSALVLISGLTCLNTGAETPFNNSFLEYTTEAQYNFEDKFNWVNLWTLGTDIKLYRNGYFNITAISTWKTSKERIANDLQTFSNIEEDNMPLNLFVAGYMQELGMAHIFFGLRNMNVDYFIGDYTSLFTNSTCGIYSTIAENYTVANYPLSAMSLHFEADITENLTLKNSLYNGRARQLSDNGISLFKIDPENDGFMNITELSYQTNIHNYGLYNIGIGLCNRYYSYNEDDQKINKKFNYTLWGSVKQQLFSYGRNTLGVMFQGSLAGRSNSYCKSYIGGGFIMGINDRTHIGAFVDHAVFSVANETAMEITCRHAVTDYLELQPAFHHIITGGHKASIALLRVILTL
ncbi:MAG: carbohydrate porin [Rikenellaceae bacterium]|nr:carbohydrate porin [Rikenellaceae bacterium]